MEEEEEMDGLTRFRPPAPGGGPEAVRGEDEGGGGEAPEGQHDDEHAPEGQADVVEIQERP